mgnify:FL=1
MVIATVLFGPERRRRWSEDERRRLLATAFAPGAVVTRVARDNDVSTSLIYKWRQEARAERAPTFVPAILAEPPLRFHAEPMGVATGTAAVITIELSCGARVSIASEATVALVTATLRALR